MASFSLSREFKKRFDPKYSKKLLYPDNYSLNRQKTKRKFLFGFVCVFVCVFFSSEILKQQQNTQKSLGNQHFGAYVFHTKYEMHENKHVLPALHNAHVPELAQLPQC